MLLFLKENLAEKKNEEAVVWNYNLKIWGFIQKLRMTSICKRECARSDACILYTSIARLDSRIGCSTLCGHQMEEETRKWTVVSHVWDQLVPPRDSLVVKTYLLCVISQHLGLPKGATVIFHSSLPCVRNSIRVVGRHRLQHASLASSTVSNTQA